MQKILIGLVVLLLGSPAFAADILRCEYAKADISKGANAPMIPYGSGKVEFDGRSFKATRPMGSFILSPALGAGNNGMLFSDDKVKVFAVSSGKNEFAVSDRVARTTEQWTNCKVDEEIALQQNGDAELAAVERLSGTKAKNYFMHEKHAFSTNCLVWDDVTMITGKSPAMLIAGAVHMGSSPKWDGKEYSFKFNGGSMIARFTPSNPKHKLLIQSQDSFYGCGPSVVDHNYD